MALELFFDKTECINYCGYFCGNTSSLLTGLKTTLTLLIFVVLGFVITKSIKTYKQLQK